MSKYNRTRKAERLHRLGALFLLLVQGIGLTLLLAMNAALLNQSLFAVACGTSVIPVALLGTLGGPFYRWCRVVGQSRWLALLPTALLTFWAVTSILLLGTLSDATEPMWLTTHGILFGGVVLSFALVALNRRSRRPAEWPQKDQTPTHEEMTHVLETLRGFGNATPWEVSIQDLVKSSSEVRWDISGEAGEELAGTLLALKGLLADSLSPTDGSIQDGIAVAERALRRVQQKTAS